MEVGGPAVPDSLVLSVWVRAASIPAALPACLEARAAAGLPPLVSWEVPADTPARPGPPGDLAAALRAAAAGVPGGRRPSRPTAQLNLGGGHYIYLQGEAYLRGRVAPDVVRVRLSLATGGAAGPPLPLARAMLVGWCRALLAALPVEAASCTHQGEAGGRCLPVVPVIGQVELALATAGEVSAAYEEPAIFWGAGWDVHEVHGDWHLLTRGMDTPDTIAYLAAVWDGQWALARAARPGLTPYGPVPVAPAERAIYERGGATLHPVGYLPGERLVEFSCAVPPGGEHVAGWEIYALAALLAGRRTASGEPLDAVRAVFAYLDTARAERRPLLDVGCRVLAYDSAGRVVDLAT